MNPQFLNKILLCPTLPSLPAVAVRVLELTSDPDVRMDDLAQAIQLDQALAAKVLRTVNSSFYSLREPCSTIKKALVLLGLGPVKSLVLGFSLVSSVSERQEMGFDWVEYWRRGIYTAVAGKIIAERVIPAKADEVFLCGLLQDIGVVAMLRTLGRKYGVVLEKAGGDHAKVTKHELEAFESHHGEIGAMLCEHWRMPQELVLPVKFHERPTAAPVEVARQVQCVWLGRAVHDVLTAPDAAPALRSLYTRAKEWLNISGEDVDAFVEQAGASVGQMSKLFRLNTGIAADAESVLAEANKNLLRLTRDDPRTSYGAEGLGELIAEATDTDPLTGAVGPSGFDAAMFHAFDAAVRGDTDLSLVQVLVGGLTNIARTHGQFVSDDVVIGIVSLLNKHFEPLGGVICRIGQPILSVVVPAADNATARATLDAFEHELAAARGWLPEDAHRDEYTVLVGLASVDENTRFAHATPNDLVVAASKCIQQQREEDRRRHRPAA